MDSNGRLKCTQIVSAYLHKPLQQNFAGPQIVLRNVSANYTAWDLRVLITEPNGSSFFINQFYIIDQPSWWDIFDSSNHGIFVLPRTVVRFGIPESINMDSTLEISFKTDEKDSVSGSGSWKFKLNELPVVVEKRPPTQ